MSAATAQGAQVARDANWHGLTAEEASSELGVDPRTGLDAA